MAGTPGFRSPSSGGRVDREDELLRENQALRERLSRLSEASLRINVSLDLDTVLQGVLDAARALTRSRYGGMAVFEDSGELEIFVLSGFDAEAQDRFLNLPEGQAAAGAATATPTLVRGREPEENTSVYGSCEEAVAAGESRVRGSVGGGRRSPCSPGLPSCMGWW